MKEKLYWHQQIYMYGIYISYVLYACFFFNILGLSPIYLNTINLVMRAYTCIYLIVYFNPFTKHISKSKEFDRRLIFSSSIILLISSFF